MARIDTGGLDEVYVQVRRVCPDVIRRAGGPMQQVLIAVGLGRQAPGYSYKRRTKKNGHLWLKL